MISLGRIMTAVPFGFFLAEAFKAEEWSYGIMAALGVIGFLTYGIAMERRMLGEDEK